MSAMGGGLRRSTQHFTMSKVRCAMAKRRRRMFTAAESAEVWDRWQRGEGLNLIGRIIGRRHTAVFAHMNEWLYQRLGRLRADRLLAAILRLAVRREFAFEPACGTRRNVL